MYWMLTGSPFLSRTRAEGRLALNLPVKYLRCTPDNKWIATECWNLGSTDTEITGKNVSWHWLEISSCAPVFSRDRCSQMTTRHCWNIAAKIVTLGSWRTTGTEAGSWGKDCHQTALEAVMAPNGTLGTMLKAPHLITWEDWNYYFFFLHVRCQSVEQCSIMGTSGQEHNRSEKPNAICQNPLPH